MKTFTRYRKAQQANTTTNLMNIGKTKLPVFDKRLSPRGLTWHKSKNAKHGPMCIKKEENFMYLDNLFASKS